MPCCQKGEKYIVQALQGRIPCRSANVSVGVACEGTRVRITLQSLPDPALACSCLHMDCEEAEEAVAAMEQAATVAEAAEAAEMAE
eukprot:7384817-Prymnesium_polylepis.1